MHRSAQSEIKDAVLSSHWTVLPIVLLLTLLLPGNATSDELLGRESVMGELASDDGAVLFELQIAQRKLQGDLKTLRVKQGKKVRLSWFSDEDVALHLHGYNIHQMVRANVPAEMVFEAHATGRFSITSHGFGGQKEQGGKHHHALIYLEVHPN